MTAVNRTETANFHQLGLNVSNETSKRGDILDRNGKQLAVSASVETVSASPSQLSANKKNVPLETVAKGLSEILELDYEETLAKTIEGKIPS